MIGKGLWRLGIPLRALRCLFGTRIAAGNAVLCMLLAASSPQLANGFQNSRPSPQQLLERLNGLKFDVSQLYSLRNVRLTRDGVSFYFSRGFLGLLAPVNGTVTGAAFEGDGEVILIPSSPVERESLAHFIQSPILDEKFSTAYLRFTDDTASELLARAQPPDPEELPHSGELVSAWNGLASKLNQGLSLRVLEDLVSVSHPEYFNAEVQGLSHGPFDVLVDERRPEAIDVMAVGTFAGTPYSDTWCSFKSSSQLHNTESWKAPLRALSYGIDTRILADKTLEGHAELEVEAVAPVRFLAFELSGSLEVTSVRDQNGASIPEFQGPLPPQVAKPSERNNWVAVILPEPATPGRPFRLEFEYHGDVITDMGNGVLYVGAHGSWYPNLGLSQPASYDLTFEYPDNLTLVATGRRVQESEGDGFRRSHWVSDGPLPVAGFNLGPYDVATRDVDSVRVSVYATPEAEASLERRYLAAQEALRAAEQPARVGVLGAEGAAPFGRPGVPSAPPALPPLTPASLVGKVADTTANTISYLEKIFGPFPYPRLAIAQIPGDFGQGWPELIYLPTLAFLPSDILGELSVNAESSDIEDRATIEHEIAHQWWGNVVGWSTYHDQWLSEGFATYAAALELRQERNGDRLFRELLRDYRRDLLAKGADGETVESAGPIWLGGRLSNSLDPGGYQAVVYKKSCWVLHMLRLLMTDPETGSDTRFFQMLRDFASQYRGRDPSTEDFMHHAERYMSRAADLDGDHRLDWFFKEWVYSTGLPVYRLKTSIRRLGAERYRVDGTITQTGGPENFEMVVPVTIAYGAIGNRAGSSQQQLIPFTGAGGAFHFTTKGRPDHISIEDNSILMGR
jgi:Peptidase family M1 domain